MATWRTADSESAATSSASAEPAEAPARIRSSPRGPYATSGRDWVATAPTPASAQVTTRPVAK